MITPKKKTKSAKPKQQPVQQHYQPVTDDEVILPVPPPTHDISDESRNLRVLRHYFPDVLSVVHIAPMATIYKYSSEETDDNEKEWEKTNLAGVLFVAILEPRARQGHRFSIIILSRHSLDQFELELFSPSLIELESNLLVINGPNEGDATYGIYIFEEPEPSSTAGQAERTALIVKECAKQAELSIQAAATENHQQQQQPQPQEVEARAPDLISAGRQLSLTDIFSQGRQADAGFSQHSHVESLQSIPQEPEQPKPSSSLFGSNPDTDFFRSGPTPSKTTPKPPTTQKPAPATGSISVADLFRSTQIG
jgi:hypothetical protein